MQLDEILADLLADRRSMKQVRTLQRSGPDVWQGSNGNKVAAAGVRTVICELASKAFCGLDLGPTIRM